MNSIRRLIKFSWVVVVVFGLLCSCADKGSRLPDSEEIYEEFQRSPAEAVQKYRVIWKQSTGIHERDLSNPDQLSVLFITQQLLEKDGAGYDDYYSYAMKKVGSDNSKVVAFAMSALGSARGAEATDVLVAHTKTSDSLVRRSAIDALAWQVAKLEYAPNGSSDYRYALLKMKDICGKRSADHYTKSACEQLGL